MNTTGNTFKDSVTNIFDKFGLAWWVEIETRNPKCTYYFGPFLNGMEAEASVKGYVEDLELEGAQGINVNVKRCKPKVLTISDDSGEWFDRKVKPVFSGQI